MNKNLDWFCRNNANACKEKKYRTIGIVSIVVLILFIIITVIFIVKGIQKREYAKYILSVQKEEEAKLLKYPIQDKKDDIQERDENEEKAQTLEETVGKNEDISWLHYYPQNRPTIQELKKAYNQMGKERANESSQL